MTNYLISSSNISIYSKSNKFIFKPDCPALPSGTSENHKIQNVGKYAYYWSSMNKNGEIYLHGVAYGEKAVNRFPIKSNSNSAYAVRCVKNIQNSSNNVNFQNENRTNNKKLNAQNYNLKQYENDYCSLFLVLTNNSINTVSRNHTGASLNDLSKFIELSKKIYSKNDKKTFENDLLLSFYLCNKKRSNNKFLIKYAGSSPTQKYKKNIEECDDYKKKLEDIAKESIITISEEKIKEIKSLFKNKKYYPSKNLEKIFFSKLKDKDECESFLKWYPNSIYAKNIVKLKEYFNKEEKATKAYNNLIKEIKNRDYNYKSKVFGMGYARDYTIIESKVRKESLNYNVRKVLGILADARGAGDNLKSEFRGIDTSELVKMMKDAESYLNRHYYGDRKTVYEK